MYSRHRRKNPDWFVWNRNWIRRIPSSVTPHHRNKELVGWEVGGGDEFQVPNKSPRKKSGKGQNFELALWWPSVVAASVPHKSKSGRVEIQFPSWLSDHLEIWYGLSLLFLAGEVINLAPKFGDKEKSCQSSKNSRIILFGHFLRSRALCQFGAKIYVPCILHLLSPLFPLISRGETINFLETGDKFPNGEKREWNFEKRGWRMQAGTDLLRFLLLFPVFLV